MKICFSVSPIGLGHASRSVAIASEMIKLGYRIQFLSGGNVVDFLSSYNFEVTKFHDNIPYFNVSNKGVLKNITWWMIKYIRFYKRSKKKAIEFLETNKCDAVISDEDFAFATVAIDKDIKTIFITDLVQTHFAKNWFAKIIEKRTNEWFRQFYEKSPITIVPEEEGEKIGNMHFVGPIVRKLTENPQKVRKKLGLDGKIILVTSGGTPIGKFLFEKTTGILNRIRDKIDEEIHLILVGKHAKNYENQHNILAFDTYRDLQNLIAASDLVITTAGKSTIDECRVYKKPCIAIPIKGHYEQERNAKKLGYSYEDIKQLDKLILNQLENPKVFPTENNLEKTIELINNFLRI